MLSFVALSLCLLLSTFSLSSAQQAPVAYTFLYDGFSIPFDVATDPSGNVYIADQRTNSAFKLNPQVTGSPLVYYNNTTPGLNAPDGLCLDNSVNPPNVFVVDSGNQRVLKFNNAGQLILTIGQYQPAISLQYPWNCAVDPAGLYLYISNTVNQTINRVFASNGSSAGNYSNTVNSIGFLYPNQITLDGSNPPTYLFVADASHNLVAQIRLADGVQTNVYRLAGNASPNGVAVDTRGVVYVTDTGNNRVLVFAPNGTNIYNLTTSGPALQSPRGIWVDNQFNVYVADSSNARIVKFWSLQSGYTGGNGGGVPAQQSINGYTFQSYFGFNGPYDVALDSSNNLYVADTYNARVVKVGSGGAVTQTFTTSPVLQKPEGVCLDQQGNVYIADNAQVSNIYKLNAQGQQQMVILGTAATPPLSYIWNCAVDSSGYIYVSNTNNQGITKFAPNGTQVGFFNVSNPSFNYPNQVSLDSSNSVLYVADSVNFCVIKIAASNGTQLQPVFSLPTNSYPNGVTVDNSGTVYVSDTNANSVWVFFANGSYAYQFAFPANTESFMSPRGMAVDGNGNIYVADSGNNRIVIFNKPSSGPNAAASSATVSAAALLVALVFSLALLL